MQYNTSNNAHPTRRWLTAIMGLVGLTLLASTTNAQAGIDIRAPFTHVGVDRDHGVNVAAPFTRVNVGGHGHHDDRRGYYRGRGYDRRAYGHHRDWRAERRDYRRDYHRDYRRVYHDQYRPRYDHDRRYRDDRGRGFFGLW